MAIVLLDLHLRRLTVSAQSAKLPRHKIGHQATLLGLGRGRGCGHIQMGLSEPYLAVEHSRVQRNLRPSSAKTAESAFQAVYVQTPDSQTDDVCYNVYCFKPLSWAFCTSVDNGCSESWTYLTLRES